MSLAHKLSAVRSSARTMPSCSEQEVILLLVGQGDPYSSLFFSEVEDPAWIPKLESHGFFRDIPELIRHKDGSTLYPRSLALHGLARLAPKAPETVARIIKEFPRSGNVVVGDQLMRCMLAIRDSQQVPILLPIAAELISTGGRSTRLYLRDLLKSWVELGRAEEALTLLSTFIDAVVRAEPSLRRSQHAAWELAKCDSDILAPLSQTDPGSVVTVCFKALCAYYDASQPRSEKLDQDLDEFPDAAMNDPRDFTAWLEDFRQSGLRRGNPGVILAHRLHASLLPIYRDDPANREKQDKALVDHPWHLFTRLRCQLYADVPEQTLDSARREVFATLANINRADCRHGFEFASMLENHATCHGSRFLSEEEVGSIVSKVREGPLDHDSNVEPDQSYQRRFWRMQLWPIRSLLSEEMRKQLDQWAVTETGKRIESEMEDYKPVRSYGRSGFIQDRSPYTLDELAALTDDELWQVLNNWANTKDWIEGDNLVEECVRELAITFAELITTRADRFPASSKWWHNLQRPVMLSAPLEAWAKSLSPDKEKDTEPPASVHMASAFGVIAHIVSVSQNRPRNEGVSGDSAANPDWHQARLASAHFLKAFIRNNLALSDWSDKVEDLLKKLITGAEDRLDRFERSEHHDWQFEAINSVRGEAWEALLLLALKERNHPEPSAGTVSPWIHGLLTERLDPEVSESPAIYSLLGSQLRVVVYALPDWVQEHKALLFPSDRPECLRAITDGHLAYDQPHQLVAQRLPEFPALALDVADRRAKAEEDDGDAVDSARDVSSRLGFHIAFYLWNDWFSDSKTGMHFFDRFLSIATSKARAETMSYIGTAFEKAERKPEIQPLIDRAQAMLDRWLDWVRGQASVAESGSFDTELGQFADLIAAECFPFAWRVEVASTALELISRPLWSFQLLDTLEEWSDLGEEQPERTAAGIRLLATLTSDLSDELRWSIQTKQLMPILRKGLSHADANVKKQANQVIENLLRHGFFELLDLNTTEEE